VGRYTGDLACQGNKNQVDLRKSPGRPSNGVTDRLRGVEGQIANTKTSRYKSRLKEESGDVTQLWVAVNGRRLGEDTTGPEFEGETDSKIKKARVKKKPTIEESWYDSPFSVHIRPNLEILAQGKEG